MTTTPPLILLAAGGTGGHLFPAQAVAEDLLRRGYHVGLVTDQRGSSFGQAVPEVTTYRIRAASPAGNIVRKLSAAVELGIGYLQARRLMRRLRPAAVIGFGGYPTVPLVYAAHRAGVPIALHEQNAVLGRANRMLATRAALVATAFPQVAELDSAASARIIATGNPVRPAIAAIRDLAPPPFGEDDALRLLILGGSQGARIFSDVVPEAVALLPEDRRARLSIVQQCRPEDLDRVEARYRQLGVTVELSTFFSDMPDRLARCHMMIARSGASTVAEMTAAGRPGILVPYPFAADNHQNANAEAVADAGGAWLMPQHAFTPEALADRLEALLALPASLETATTAARKWGTVSAASRLAEAVEALAPLPGNADNGRTPSSDRPADAGEHPVQTRMEAAQ